MILCPISLWLCCHRLRFPSVPELYNHREAHTKGVHARLNRRLDPQNSASPAGRKVLCCSSPGTAMNSVRLILPLDLCSSEFSLPGPAGQRRLSPDHCQQTTPLPPGRLWKSLMQVAGKFVSVIAVSWASWYAATAAWMVSLVLASQVTRLHKQNTLS